MDGMTIRCCLICARIYTGALQLNGTNNEATVVISLYGLLVLAVLWMVSPRGMVMCVSCAHQPATTAAWTCLINIPVDFDVPRLDF
jgi:hypothetical protein